MSRLAVPRYRVPGTVPRRVLWGLVTFLLLSVATERLLGLFSPCAATGLACEDPTLAGLLVGLVDLAQLGAVYGTTFALGLYRFVAQTTLTRRLSQHPDHWTMASSRDVFAECARVVKSAQDTALATIGMVTLLSASVRISDVLADRSRSGKGNKQGDEVWARLDAICGGPALSQCHLAYLSYDPMIMVASGGMLYLFGAFLFTPARAWSPVFQEAARQERDPRLARLPAFAWALLGLGFIALGCAVHLNVRVAPLQASAGEMAAYLWASAGLVSAEVGVIVWLHGLYWLWPFPGRLARVCRAVASTGAAMAGSLTYCWRSNRRVARLSAGLWQPPGRQSAFLVYEDSRRFRHLVLLLVLVFLWVFSAVSSSWVYAVVMWGCRIVALALLVFTRDAPADFRDLAGQPGFGLVADKRDLLAALRARLAGQEYAGAVRRYKASTLRMQETMAISYRWQVEQVDLCDDLGVNMSRWQMEQLLDVLEQCNCQYAWIDRISIPQSGFSAMKRTLLARMMAVYASAGFTLVLRSLELEGERYHQRGWTLQEYCNASQIIVRTQDAQGADLESSFASLNEADAELARCMREEKLQKAPDMKPFWLYGDGLDAMEEQEVLRRQRLYLDLVGRLHTEELADMPRALCPLVWDRPVESQEELIELVRHVSERTSGNTAGFERAALDLRLLLSTYTRVSRSLSNMASRITGSGAAPVQGIARATNPGTPKGSSYRRSSADFSGYTYAAPEPGAGWDTDMLLIGSVPDTQPGTT
eukprot:jgi/Tetstr1/421162/TSEL_012205.t1